MKRKLIDVCLLNNYKQLDAQSLEELRTFEGKIKLLPSSKDYDWVTNLEIAKDYLCEGEIITLGKARYANIKYHNGLFVSANNIIIESNDKENILTKYIYYYCFWNNKKFYVEATTYPKFDMKSFENSLIEIPKKNVQQEIINKLDNLFWIIKNQESQLILYDELIKSRFNGQDGVLYVS
ncbi:MAG: restriction endonuclease subunit S [Malacoplasma sp.]|nr:restriction endonuclease subunit S [Malacoplasma sp.]